MATIVDEIAPLESHLFFASVREGENLRITLQTLIGLTDSIAVQAKTLNGRTSLREGVPFNVANAKGAQTKWLITLTANAGGGEYTLEGSNLKRVFP